MKINDRIKKVREIAGLSQDDFAASIGLKRPNYANIETGRQGPTLEVLSEIITKYKAKVEYLSYDWLITGVASPTASPTASPSQPNVLKQEKKGNETGLVIAAESADKYAAKTRQAFEAPKVVTVDGKGRDNCVLVAEKARAGYLSHYGDPEWIAELPVLSIPQLKHGTYRAFVVSGLSMYDTLNDGDVIVCKYATSNDFINDRVYTLVTHSEGVIVKRCIFHASGVLVKSDNNLSGEWPSYTVPFADIAEIWQGYMRFTYQLAAPGLIYKRVSTLEQSLALVQEQLNKISTKI